MRHRLLVCIILTIFFTISVTISYVVVRTLFISQVKKSLLLLISRIQNDLVYENEQWITSKYNADPFTPHPSGSSGFANPLYIITTEGFVIERNRPISGLLDTSDYERLLTFSTPTTINTVTNERWRVLSKPIISNNSLAGVVMTSYYNPAESAYEEIDKKLESNSYELLSLISSSEGILDVSEIDIRTIDYEISFEVVNLFNKVLINNGRTPTFIDPSYIEQFIQTSGTWTFNDSLMHEQYLFVTDIFRDSQGIPKAIIVAGESIDFVDSSLRIYILTMAIVIIISVFLSTFFITHLYFSPHVLHKIVADRSKPVSIQFIPESGTVVINEVPIEIPLHSYQYKILSVLFSDPNKAWRQNTLLKIFHESGSTENTRKTYDAMIAVNRKLSFKLITYKDRTYRIDPSYLPHIVSSNS